MTSFANIKICGGHLICAGLAVAISFLQTAKIAHAENTNAVVTIPQSTFVIPASSQEGRDPFYPNTTRSPAGGDAGEKGAAASGAFALELKGLSGVPGNRLAMISAGGVTTRTLAEGETSEIPTKSGKVSVRCLQIKSKSVVVEAGGSIKELQLRQE